MFPCPVCRQSFQSNNGLVAHLKVSTGKAHTRYRIKHMPTPEERQQKEERKKQWEEKEKQREEEMQQHRLKFEVEKRHRASHPEPPEHPDYSKRMDPDGIIEISSGGICFGFRHNVKTGALLPLTPVSAALSEKIPPGNGTILQWQMQFNIEARNGTWRGYKFVQRSTPNSPIGTHTHDLFKGIVIRCGAFICHSDLDPIKECRRILYHSVDSMFSGGSLIYQNHDQPYRHLEILVINRYDWGRYDLRSSNVKDTFGSAGANLERKGLHVIDYEQAKKKHNWDASFGRMRHDGDWNYGRIGIKDGKAVSFMLLDECSGGYGNIYFRNGTSPLGQDDWTEPQTIQRTDPLEIPKPVNNTKITDFFKGKRDAIQAECDEPEERKNKNKSTKKAQHKDAETQEVEQKLPDENMMAKRKEWKEKKMCYVCKSKSEFDLHGCQCFKRDENYGLLICEDCIDEDSSHWCDECSDRLCTQFCKYKKCEGCRSSFCSRCLSGDDGNDNDNESIDSSTCSVAYFTESEDEENGKYKNCSSCSKISWFCEECATDDCWENVSTCHVCKAVS